MDTARIPSIAGNPFQRTGKDRADIRAFRTWHRETATRARRAGFDIVYVYATYEYLLSRFLSPQFNTRGAEYSGSLESRVGLVGEVIEDTNEAVGHDCGVAVRVPGTAQPFDPRSW